MQAELSANSWEYNLCAEEKAQEEMVDVHADGRMCGNHKSGWILRDCGRRRGFNPGLCPYSKSKGIEGSLRDRRSLEDHDHSPTNTEGGRRRVPTRETPEESTPQRG